MRARFVGDPNDGGSGPQQITCWGLEFVKGEWREVGDERFARHSHFQTDEAQPPSATPAPGKRRQPKGR